MAPSRSDQLRWWFVVVGIAIGLIAMHSLVGHEQVPTAPSPTAMAAALDSSSCCDSEHLASCCEREHLTPAGATENTAPHHNSALMTLLHLCLAILTGLALLAIAALLAFARLAAGLSHHAALLALRFDRTRSPPPTSVRLAQLCVLRC